MEPIPESGRDLSSLAPPPRRVPLAIQWQLFSCSVVLIVGAAFVLVSLLAFIIPQLVAGNRFESAWQFFPFIHLVVGLGMVMAPLIAWRRKVALLRQGQLAPTRITAIQDQGSRSVPHRESHGVRNLGGPWVDYETALIRARKFWNSTLLAGPPEAFNPVTLVLSGFGCILTGFGLFGALFTVAALPIIWFGKQQGDELARACQTLALLAFMAVYLGTAWFMRRWVNKVKRFFAGELSMGEFKIVPLVRCRHVFTTADGRQLESTAYLDLRERLRHRNSTAADVAAYWPDDPERALLLGSIWPPITIENGSWVRQSTPTASLKQGDADGQAIP